MRQCLPVSQLKDPAATTVGPTWEAVPATTPVDTMATVAMTTTVSYKACKIKSSCKMLHHLCFTYYCLWQTHESLVTMTG